MVEIVPPEDEMVADRDAVELHFLPLEPLFLRIAVEGVNDRKVRRAAANVANEDAISRLDDLGPRLFMALKPRVERRLRFFDQRDAGEFGEFRRVEG